MAEHISFNAWELPLGELKSVISYLQSVQSQRRPLSAAQELHQMTQQTGMKNIIEYYRLGRGDQRWTCSWQIGTRLSEVSGPTKKAAKEAAARGLLKAQVEWCNENCGCLERAERQEFPIAGSSLDRPLPTPRDEDDDVTEPTLQWRRWSEEEKRAHLDQEIEEYQTAGCIAPPPSPASPSVNRPASPSVNRPASPSVNRPASPSVTSDGPATLQVDGLDSSISSSDLAGIFHNYELKSISILTNEFGTPNGRGLIQFATSTAAQDALREYQEAEVDGCIIHLTLLNEETRLLLRVSNVPASVLMRGALIEFLESVGPLKALLTTIDPMVVQIQYRYREHTQQALAKLNGALFIGRVVDVVAEGDVDADEWTTV